MTSRLYSTKKYLDVKIDRILKEFASLGEFNARVKALEDSGILRPFPGFGAGVYSLLGRESVDAEEAACSIDPFWVEQSEAATQRELREAVHTILSITILRLEIGVMVLMETR